MRWDSEVDREPTGFKRARRETYQWLGPAQVRENRGEDTYTLNSTLVTWLATQPEQRRAIEPQ